MPSGAGDAPRGRHKLDVPVVVKSAMPRPARRSAVKLVALCVLALAASSSMMALLASPVPSPPVAVALQPLAAQVRA